MLAKKMKITPFECESDIVQTRMMLSCSSR